MPPPAYVLADTTSFAHLARAFEHVLELTRVVSCTFPGRPEPREALWSDEQGLPVLQYTYEPDIEIRHVVVRQPGHDIFRCDADGEVAFERMVAAESGAVPFARWDALLEDLRTGPHQRMARAAAAFRLASRVKHPEVDGVEILMAELVSPRLETRRAAANEIGAVVKPTLEMELRRIEAVETDLEVRMHLREAINACFRA